jgi:hypothetical protein
LLQVASAAYIYSHYRYIYSGSNVLSDLKFQEISEHYKNSVRTAATDFEFLFNRIAPSIVKQNTFLRKSIPIEERSALALRFLATGDSYASLQYLF